MDIYAKIKYVVIFWDVVMICYFYSEGKQSCSFGKILLNLHIFHYIIGEMKASSLLSCEVITWLREDDGQLRHLGKQPTMDSMGCKLLRRPGDLTGHKKEGPSGR